MFRKRSELEVPEVDGLWGFIHLKLIKPVWSYEYKFGHLLDVQHVHPAVRQSLKRTSTAELTLQATISWLDIVDEDIPEGEDQPCLREDSGLFEFKGNPCEIRIGEVDSTSDMEELQWIGGGRQQNGNELFIGIGQTADEIKKLLSILELTEHDSWTAIRVRIEQRSKETKCSIAELMRRFAVNWIEIRSHGT